MSAETEAEPGSVFTPRQVRLLKIAVIVMGVMLVAGFALLVVGIYYQASQIGQRSPAATPAPAAGTPPATARIAIAGGGALRAVAMDGDRLTLHVRGPRGDELVVLDLASGREVMRIALEPEQ